MHRATLCLFLLLFTETAFAEQARFRRSSRPVPNEYIVVLKNVDRSQVTAVAEQLQTSVGGRVFGPLLTNGIKGFGMRMTESQAKALSNHPFVDFVEENGYVDISYTTQPFTNDAFWNLDRVDNLGPIYSYKAYGYTYTGQNVRAYVIDSGVQAKHYEFDLDGNPLTTASRVEPGANMVVS